MRLIPCLVLLFLLSACSCGQKFSGPPLRLGVDSTWVPLNFEELQPYVNGYTEDVLLEISRYSGLKFEKMTANANSLFDGLQRGQYDAVLSSLAPYTFNMAKYDFSANFLDIGPVLVVAQTSSFEKLEQIPKDNLVGVVRNDPAEQLVQKQGRLIQRNYNSIPELLDAVVAGDVVAALLDRPHAAAFVRDLYQQSLKIASGPLTQEGLHLVHRKNNQSPAFRAFQKGLQALQENKKLEELQKKWRLIPS